MLVNVIMINYIDYLLLTAHKKKKNHTFFSFDISMKESIRLHHIT